MAINVRYVHKQIDRAVEDTGALDAQSNEIYVIANPGEGLTAIAHPGVANPKAVRDYDAVEFAVEKRLPTTGSFAAAICGAACTATSPASHSRTKTDAPARTSAGCGTTR